MKRPLLCDEWSSHLVEYGVDGCLVMHGALGVALHLRPADRSAAGQGHNLQNCQSIFSAVCSLKDTV